MARCDECSYDFESLGRDEIIRDVLSLADEHRILLAFASPERLRAHSRPDTWSALEYACHVRDVLRFQRERVVQAQAEDMPRFVSMDRDERAVADRYNDQDPEVVALQITAAAGEFTTALLALEEAGWLCMGIYPWPAPEARTVEWIGHRTAHELAHHLFDNRRLLNSA